MTTRRAALKMMSAATLLPMVPQQAFAETMKISIRVTMPPSPVAPAGVFLEAVVEGAANTTRQSRNGGFPEAYHADFHTITYVWSLPDAGPYRTPDHLVGAHRSTAQSFGPFIARVFEKPGQHRVFVDAFSPDGRWGRAEAIVDVVDPLKVFGADNNIVVSADGDFTGAPTHHPVNRTTNLADAFERYSRLSLTHAQILLKRGNVYQSPPKQGLQFKSQIPHCFVGAWGGGARPQIDLSDSSGSLFLLQKQWDGHSLVIQNLHFKGGWDPTTELWKNAQQGAVIATRGDAALLMHDCLEEGCAVTVNSRAPKQPSGIRAMTFFNEYAKTDYKDFLLLGPREDIDVAITGCRVVQNPMALNGGENRRATSYGLYGRNAHSFVRCSARRLYIASNDIFVRHGWALNKVFDNPAFRLNRNDAPDMRVVIARNHIEGMIVRASKRGAVPMNLLIEQNYIVSNPALARAITLRGGAATVRNNIILEHDTPKPPGTGSGFSAFILLGWDGENSTTRDMPFWIYNNSFILLRSDENAPHGPVQISNEDPSFTEVHAANNLLWAPSLSVDPTSDGPLDRTPLDWDARYHGARLGWARIKEQRLTRHMFPGDEMLVSYWTDFLGTPLQKSDFQGQAGRHAVIIRIEGKNRAFDALSGEVAFRFEDEGVRVTNLSPVRWPEGAEYTLHCDRGTTPMAMQTQFGHPPGTLSLYKPLPQSGAWQSATTGLVSFYDFLGQLRPGTKHPNAQSGNASRGAMEP